MEAKKGDWVRIHNIVLRSEDRASSIPEDTAKVDLEMWNKGFLLNENAKIGEHVEVETIIGRRTEGTLIEIDPYWSHSYGKAVPEILYIGKQAKELLRNGGELHD